MSSGLKINITTETVEAYRNVSVKSASVSWAMQRLLSGLGIDRADDSAGLPISERLRGQVKATDRASRNTQDAIPSTQVAGISCDEARGILQRIK